MSSTSSLNLVDDSATSEWKLFILDLNLNLVDENGIYIWINSISYPSAKVLRGEIIFSFRSNSQHKAPRELTASPFETKNVNVLLFDKCNKKQMKLSLEKYAVYPGEPLRVSAFFDYIEQEDKVL